ncbi:hypothetical protein [Pseudoclavibacter sp. AY1H1]|uniref:hypothetical protein n=1 Tax=Pseudoclavibacter sp. AY1H1 TaxID=2080584 RepID=UPI000CE81838|nr:hypothetical protein [Pseudoclavibacter sp. AY1H1]PPF39941.1 hypothetical protein C5E05_01645 [Pseudoclavibacter sp. AY1H1]
MTYIDSPWHAAAQLLALIFVVVLMSAALHRINDRATRALALAEMALGKDEHVTDSYDRWSDQRLTDETEQENWRAARIGQAIEMTPDLWEVPVSRTFSVQGRTRVEALENAEPYREAS